ncbi:MAG TPA: glycerol-3-phosphate acyltransferase [Acidimicrobiales bacterium]
MTASALAALAAAGLVAASYLVGTIPTALIVTRRRGVDPTQAGSGNPGATNVLRTSGWLAGAVTLAGDAGKGAAAAAVGWAAGGHGLGVACGVAAVAGHVLPVTRGWRGGKGVATGAGMAAVLYPAAAVAATLVFAITLAVYRKASLGSIAAVSTLPVGVALGGAPGAEVAALVVCAGLIVARHRDNIVRLVRGTEPRLGAGS